VTYYRQVFDNVAPPPDRFWAVEDGIARRLDVIASRPERDLINCIGDPVVALGQEFPGSTFHKLLMAPGEYYPRMARPSSMGEVSPGHNPDDSVALKHSRTESSGQLHALIEQLDQIGRAS
jgi:hypothetical protein